MEPTHELPIVEGFYWTWKEGEVPTITEVYFRQKAAYAVSIGDETHYSLRKAPDGLWWQGPIPFEAVK
jgi:hypothetical protein